MLEINGLKCWVTTADLIDFPATLNHSDSPRVASCTVKLPSSRKSFIIHWCSTTPITAWCEVNLKNSLGKINAGVVKCEMDANHPATQKRSTQEYRGVSGRNLAFVGRKLPTSGNLGTVWVEIRRATAIEVNEVSTLNKKLTITWVTSDHPDSGVPFVTFIINFELDEQAANASTTGAILSSPGVPSVSRSSARRGSTEEKAENGATNPDSSNGDFGEFTSPAPTAAVSVSESAVQDSGTAEAASGSGAQKRSRADSQTENNASDVKRSRMDEVAAPTTPVQNSQTTPSKTPDWASELRLKLTTKAVVPKPPKKPNVVIPNLPGPITPQIGPLSEPTVVPKTPSTHIETPVSEIPAPQTPDTHLPEIPTPQTSVQTQPDVPNQSLNQTQPDAADPKTPIPNTEVPEMTLDLSDDDEGDDDFESKLALLEVEIETCTKECAKLAEKEEFMKTQRLQAKSISDIKSLEAVCGRIPSKAPTQDNWDLINNDVPDDEKGYSEKKICIEEALPSLERYRSALQYKKLYLEKKTMLKRLKKDMQSAELRCGEISANITEILST